MKEKKIKLWHPAFGTVIAYTAILIATSTFLTFPGSMYLTEIAEDFGVSYGTAQLRMFTSGGTSILLLPFVNKLYKKYNFKILTILGVAAYCCGFIGYALSPNIYIYLACGILHGIGTTLAILIPGPYMVNAWFDKGRAIAFLIPMFFASMLASATTPWIGKLIAIYGWRYTMIMASILGIVVGGAACAAFASQTPESKGQHPFGWSKKDDAEEENAKKVIRGVSFENAKKSPQLYMFFFICITYALFMNISKYTVQMSVLSGFSTEQGISAISMYSGVMSITSILSAIVIGKLKTRKYTLIAGVINILAVLLLMYNGGNYTLFCIGVCASSLYGLQYMQQMGPKEIYGVMDFPGIFSIINIGLNFCNMFGASLYGYAYDFTGNYNLILWIQIIFIFISLLFTIYIYRKKDSLVWEEREV